MAELAGRPNASPEVQRAWKEALGFHGNDADGTLAPASGCRRASPTTRSVRRVPVRAGRAPTAADEAFRAYWTQQLPDPPAWVDLATGAVAPYAAPPGMRAVGELSLAPATIPDMPPAFPSVATAPDYYSAALILLARVARQESRRPKP